LKISRRRLIALAGITLLAYTLPGLRSGREVVVTKIPVGLGRRVLFLSDVHLHRRGERDYVVKAVEDVRGDIVVLGGDLWDSKTKNFDVVAEFVEALRRLAGAVILVPGNHEYWADKDGVVSLDDAIKRLEYRGVIVLRDEAIEARGLRIGGFDWHDNPRDYGAAAKRVGAIELAVSHSPDVFPHLTSSQRFLAAGHTHGGQVCLPGGYGVVTNSVYGYKWGFYREKDKEMYVSRGLGEKYPPRIYCAREVVVME
jgi:hypothetical protein